MHPSIVQISLDLTDIDEALNTARIAVEAGVDWLEAGTPLLLAEGLHGVRALRRAFPDHPIVADLKTMDGGYLEAEMMAKAGATHVVVMARAHVETIKVVVKAGRDYGIKVMGDNLGCEDKAARSEEHTSELQSPCNLVCRLLLEKKKKIYTRSILTTHDSPSGSCWTTQASERMNRTPKTLP